MIPADIDPITLDQEMRDDLASSLAYVSEVTGEALGCEPDDWSSALDHIRTHPVVPGVFARYYELVFALDADRPKAAQFAAEITQRASAAPSQEVVAFSAGGLDDDPELYAHMIALDSPDLLFDPPQPDQWAEFAAHAPEALDLIAAADPALGHEVATLARRICGAAAPPPPARQFGGASSFMLWGAVVFNLNRETDVVSLFDRIVHETTHQLLFGLSRAEPLVTNDLADRYTSPLRRDPRPMDGIFHATFVCARVHYALGRLLQTGRLTSDEEQVATAKLAMYATNFAGGRETVRDQGRLTPTGEKMLASAEDHMTATV